MEHSQSRSLTGISGITLAGRLLNVAWADKLKQRFEKALDEEFTQQDGTIMSIRSELTGYTVLTPKPTPLLSS